MNLTRRKIDTIIPILLWLICTPLNALAEEPSREIEPLANIRDAARTHALEAASRFSGSIDVVVGNLDRRLRLTRCDTPLETYDSPNGIKPGRSVVGVRCPGQNPWKLYVPVTIAVMETIVVTARPVPRGQEISVNDLIIKEKDVSQLHRAYYTDKQQVVGTRTRRALKANAVVHAGMLKDALMVKRGKPVLIVADRGNLKVRMKGKAMSNGTLGQVIEVKNLRSGRQIAGEVIGSGMIRIHD